MFKLPAEISPDGHAMSHLPPRRQDHIDQEKNRDHRRGANFISDEQRNSDRNLYYAYRVAKEHRVRQYDSRQNRSIETHGGAADVISQIFLKPAVCEARTRD